LPDGKDLVLVSCKTGGERAAFIEPVTVGDALPDMPLFLTKDLRAHDACRLEASRNRIMSSSASFFRCPGP
jgi:hypothetical protein